MKKILVVISKGHLTIYEAALRDYAAIHDELEIDFFILDFPSVSGLEKVKYKLNIGSYKKRYYDKKREELLNQLNKYDTVLFYNIFWDEEYFIQSDLIDSLKLKNSKVYFVDSIRQSQIPKSILEVFSDVFVFEEQDVTFIRDTYQLEAKWVTCGSSYYLFDKNIVNKELKYDVCFVGLGTQKRLEYLDIIAKWCCEHKIKLFVAGHFWHNNHKLNYLLGKLKFRLKHPYLAKFVQNRFIQPFDLAGVYAQSRIVLNINISEHKGFNQRAFDIILCNSLLICDDQDTSNLTIVEGQDFIKSKNADDMVRNISYYLFNDDERLNIIKHGKKEVMQRYLYKHTLDRLLNDL